MSDAPDDPPPPRSLYRKGYFPALRERWGERWRTFRWVVRDPGAAAARFPGWLGRQARADRDFFAAILRFFTRAVEGGVRHPRRGAWVLGFFALLGFLPPFAWERCGGMGCPDAGRLARLQPGGAATVYDAEGGVLADLASVRWEVVPISRLPAHVPAAFVAVEDQRFFRHGGVDWKRFLATTARNVIPGGRSQGASTITMQLARNVFPDRLPASERTAKRKLLEMRVALEIERRYTKEEILQTYLNHIYFGEGVYGIESAARAYFGKRARDLALPEAALLAGMLRAPNNYSPRRDLRRSTARRDLVLGLMRAQGRITPEEARRAQAAPVRLARWEAERRRTRAPYFVEQVRRTLEAELGEVAYTGKLRVYTTLDPRAQRAAEAELEAQLRRIEGGAFGPFAGPRRADFRAGAPETPYLQGGALLMDARTGDVRAWVGGRSFAESRFDRLSQGFRQPGSAFKPVVFAAAVEEGMAPTEHFRDDTLRRVLPGGEVWAPRNFDGRHRGRVTLREAARWSVNTVAVRVAERVGLDQVARQARRLGITSPVPELPSVAIGAAEVRPVELARAYTAFATLGTRVEPRYVVRVENAQGEVVWEPKPRRKRAMDPGAAFLVTTLLRDVVDRGTGRKVREAGLRGPAAGKTGTTNEAADAWFVGFTPEVVGAVWIGFDRPRPITAGGSGGELAAPVWARIVRAAQGGRVPAAWEAPPGVVARQVAAQGDRVIAPGCRARGTSYREHFLRRHLPEAACPRGTPRGEDWLTRAGEWAREAWDDVRRRVGRDGGG